MLTCSPPTIAFWPEEELAAESSAACWHTPAFSIPDNTRSISVCFTGSTLRRPSVEIMKDGKWIDITSSGFTPTLTGYRTGFVIGMADATGVKTVGWSGDDCAFDSSSQMRFGVHSNVRPSASIRFTTVAPAKPFGTVSSVERRILDNWEQNL